MNMSDAITIVNAAQHDIPELVKLLNTLFTIEKDFQPDGERQARGLSMLIAQPEHGVIKVARDSQNMIIGMVSAQLVISTAQGAASAWIEDMVVSERSRGQGVGKALLEAIVLWAKAKGATRAQLLVDIENASALAYYAHLGWETTQLQARRIFL